VFVKMDIEGWEYRVLDQVLGDQASVIGFVVEFHDVDLHRGWIDRFVAKASGRFVLVHIHANNYGPLDEAGDPTVLEMTWVRADLASSGASEPASHDGPLDYSNDASRPDIVLRFDSPGASEHG
jgi:hypothetical protein